MTYYLLLLTIFIWPFGQLLSFSLPSFSFPVYYLDISILLVFISLLINNRRNLFVFGNNLRSYSIFILIALLSLSINLVQTRDPNQYTSFLYLFRLIIYPSLYVAIKEIGFTKLKQPLVISLILFCFLCLGQYLFFPDMRFLKNLGFDDHYYRLVGPFFDPNFTGIIIVCFALYTLSHQKYLVTVPLIVLLALTFSRASYLSFLIGLIFLLIAQKRLKPILLFFLFVFSIYIIPKPFGEGVNLLRTFSIFSRIASWKEGITLFIQKPILGWGYNTLGHSLGGKITVDNSFILLLATTGIFGLLSFGNFLKVAYKELENPANKVLLVSIIVHSFFNNTFFYIWIFSFFWIFLGLFSKN